MKRLSNYVIIIEIAPFRITFFRKKKGKKIMTLGKKYPIDITVAAKYLIQLFFQSTPCYTCSRTKIEKLLTIANLTCIKAGFLLFEEKIVVNNCGTSIPFLADCFVSDIISGEIECETFSPACSLSSKNIDTSKFVPPRYQIQGDQLPDSIACLLQEIYYKFGALSAVCLGKKLRQITDITQTQNKFLEYGDKPVIDYEKAYTYLGNLNSDEANTNDILQYIYNYNNNNQQLD